MIFKKKDLPRLLAEGKVSEQFVPQLTYLVELQPANAGFCVTEWEGIMNVTTWDTDDISNNYITYSVTSNRILRYEKKTGKTTPVEFIPTPPPLPVLPGGGTMLRGG